MSAPSSTSQELTLEEASTAWEALADYVGGFLKAWEAGGEPPPIAPYLPAEPGPLRRMALVELVKIDLERRLLGAGPRKSVSQYGAEFPELLGEGGLPCDLIYEEYHVRQLAGDTVPFEEYLERFPDQADSLRRLCGFRSTRIVKSARADPEAIAIRVGQQVDDFDILSALGEGAFAQVFLARQRSMQRRVALKVSARDSDEPQTMAQLDHPNIVRVYDQRHLPERDLRLVYMEYVPGGSLQDLAEKVRRTPPPLRSGRMLFEVVDQALAARQESIPPAPWRERLSHMPWGDVVCWLGAQLASALDYAHARATLHRDLKPANVLLTSEGLPKLVDFNMAYSSKLEGASPTAYFGGSVGYMAPEHLEAFSPHHARRPDELDGRSDLYSLGLLLWELLTGGRPFADEMVQNDWAATVAAMIARRREGIPQAALDQLPKDLPPGLREVLIRCLAPDPQLRYASAGEAARELRLCLHPEVCRARQRRSGKWYRRLQRRPLLSACLLALLPNLLLSIANVSYDWFCIVLPRLPETTHAVFLGTVVTLLKTILYVLGLVVGVWLAMPAFRPLWSPVSPATLAAARRRSLRLGDMIFAVSAAAWIASGVLFPTWINWSVGWSARAIGPRDYAHFLASHTLCSLIAGTLAFFLSSFFAVRVLYPRLLELGPPEPNSEIPLLALARRVSALARVAVVVPILALATLGLGDPGFKPAFAVLTLLSLGQLYVISRLSREIQADIEALLTAVNPVVEPFASSTARMPG
jgi:serine/threonine protein kinase